MAQAIPAQRTLTRAIVARCLAAFFCLAVLCVQGQAAARCCKPGDQDCLTPYNGTRVALLAGVNKYGGDTPFADRLSDLHNAVNDVSAVAEILDKNGYSVRCLTDPTVAEFVEERKVLEQHLATITAMTDDDLQGNDVIVHFSGHGFRVDDTDFVFFSGSYTKDGFQDNSISIGNLLNKFNSFSKLNVVFVIDACRNIDPMHPNWMTGTYHDANTYNAIKSDAHTLVFSTKAGRLARDASVDIGASANGAFVFVAKKYLQFLFLAFDNIYKLSGEDPDMQKIVQTPDIVQAGLHASELGWAEQDDCLCCSAAQAAAIEYAACSGPQDAGNSCKTACRRFNQFLSLERHHAERYCSSEAFTKVFPKAGTCAVTDQPLVAALQVTPVPALAAGADLASLRKHAQLTAARTHAAALSVPASASNMAGAATIGTVVDQFRSPPRIPASGGRISASGKTFAARQQILAASRDAAGSTGVFSASASAALNAPAGPIELHLLPADGSGTTGVIQPTGPVRVDCVTQYCDGNWVALRVPTAKGNVDGWVRSEKVAPATAAESVQVTFARRSTWIDPQSYAGLQKFADAAEQNPRSFVTIVAFTRPSDEDRARAGARTLRVQSVLARRGLGDDRISTQIIDIENADDYAPVTVELLNSPG